MSDDKTIPAPGPLSRRAVLAVGGVAGASAALVVTGCATYSPQSAPAAPESGAAPAPAPQTNAAPAPSTGATKAPAASSGGTPLGPANSVPVGGGKVFAAQKVVVTQPSAGEFKAFSAVCTHQGCTVNSVSNGTISCPCHGSEFSATDGSVQGGPAKRPLAAKKVADDGGTLKLS